MKELEQLQDEIAQLRNALDDRDGRLRLASIELARLRSAAHQGADSAARWHVLDAIAKDRELTPGRLRDILTGHLDPDGDDLAQLELAFTAMPADRLAILCAEIGVEFAGLRQRFAAIDIDLDATVGPQVS
ncbi:hypothetical protein [Palleronia abyssalis]|uniref:Uncharacterized protein n=1 Tax=Palleronia abyssalis TaxID=1501240 RepID=A0A2R8BZ19_9RHOB|nr:hypothetical protein [Palleronia abyssalis]SPJ25382.1 hypothetical protein PAA8504_03233 [Palleronia abyssalis]